MSAPTIRAALEVAACALCREAKSCRGDCGDRCAWREADVSMPACAAAAVAAFHEHMAADAKRIGTARALEEAFRHESIAAAVETVVPLRGGERSDG